MHDQCGEHDDKRGKGLGKYTLLAETVKLGHRSQVLQRSGSPAEYSVDPGSEAQELDAQWACNVTSHRPLPVWSPDDAVLEQHGVLAPHQEWLKLCPL
jgi:hypothetical protein